MSRFSSITPPLHHEEEPVVTEHAEGAVDHRNAASKMKLDTPFSTHLSPFGGGM